MNVELHNGLAYFGTKFGIFWQKFCEIDCRSSDVLDAFGVQAFDVKRLKK